MTTPIQDLPTNDTLRTPNAEFKPPSARERRRSSRKHGSTKTLFNGKDLRELETSVREDQSLWGHALSSTPKTTIHTQSDLKSIEEGDSGSLSTSHWDRKTGTVQVV